MKFSPLLLELRRQSFCSFLLAFSLYRLEVLKLSSVSSGQLCKVYNIAPNLKDFTFERERVDEDNQFWPTVQKFKQLTALSKFHSLNFCKCLRRAETNLLRKCSKRSKITNSLCHSTEMHYALKLERHKFVSKRKFYENMELLPLFILLHL